MEADLRGFCTVLPSTLSTSSAGRNDYQAEEHAIPMLTGGLPDTSAEDAGAVRGGIHFTSNLLPPHIRRTRSLKELPGLRFHSDVT